MKHLTPPFATTSLIHNLFGIDARSLALFRITLASFILIDLMFRTITFTEHYGIQSIIGLRAMNRGLSSPASWSLYGLFDGNIVWAVFLFLITALAAAALLVGYRTKWALGSLLVLILSLHHANPVILQGGDTLLRVLLFTGLFLPLDKVWSLKNRGLQHATVILTPWTAVALIQGCLFYFFAVQHKIGAEWYDGTALSYVLSNYEHARALGALLFATAPALLPPLTYMVLILQWTAPLTLFSLFSTHRVRSVVLVLLMGMHTCMGIMMRIGLFSIISIAQLMLFIPSSWWDTPFAKKVVGKIGDALHRVFSTPHRQSIHTSSGSTTRYFFACCAGIYLVYIVLSQASQSPVTKSFFSARFSETIEQYGENVGLNQKWTLFTDNLSERYWASVVAEYSDGTKLDILRGGSVYDPKQLDGNYFPYSHFRQQKFYSSIRRPRNAYLFGKVGSYLCRTAHTYEKQHGSVIKISIVHHFENSPVGIPNMTLRKEKILLSGICLRN